MENVNQPKTKFKYEKPKIAILNKNKEKPNHKDWGKTNNDITIIKKSEVIEYDKDGNKIIKNKKEKVNLTRKINETAKILKNQTAKEKLELIKKQLNETL